MCLLINHSADCTASILKTDPLIARNPWTWVHFLQEIPRHGYHFSYESPLKMGMGFKAQASHPHHNQTWVPPGEKLTRLCVHVDCTKYKQTVDDSGHRCFTKPANLVISSSIKGKKCIKINHHLKLGVLFEHDFIKGVLHH